MSDCQYGAKIKGRMQMAAKITIGNVKFSFG